VKGDKVVAFCDRRCNVIAPFVVAPGNRNEAPLQREALPEVMRIVREVGMDLRGTIVSPDGVYDCRANRKAIFNRGMVPNINPNPCGRKQPKRGRKPIFEPAIFAMRELGNGALNRSQESSVASPRNHAALRSRAPTYAALRSPPTTLWRVQIMADCAEIRGVQDLQLLRTGLSATGAALPRHKTLEATCPYRHRTKPPWSRNARSPAAISRLISLARPASDVESAPRRRRRLR
jgi:hypothetical protein